MPTRTAPRPWLEPWPVRVTATGQLARAATALEVDPAVIRPRTVRSRRCSTIKLGGGRLIQQRVDSGSGVDAKLHRACRDRAAVAAGLGRIAQLAASLPFAGLQRYPRLPLGERRQRLASVDQPDDRVPHPGLISGQDQRLPAARQATIDPDHDGSSAHHRGAVRVRHLPISAAGRAERTIRWSLNRGPLVPGGSSRDLGPSTA